MNIFSMLLFTHKAYNQDVKDIGDQNSLCIGLYLTFFS